MALLVEYVRDELHCGYRSFSVEIDIEIEQGCEGARTFFSNGPHALDRR